MRILVDADACPKPIKEILYRVAKRAKLTTLFFANQPIWVAPSPFIKFILVPRGFDEADKIIVEKIEPGDLVITADIPLAAAAIEKEGFALNPRGEFYTKENIQQRLAIRNHLESLRDQGQQTRGPATLNTTNHQLFANALDRFIQSHHQS